MSVIATSVVPSDVDVGSDDDVGPLFPMNGCGGGPIVIVEL
jgi:hypothetical protein